MSIFTSGLWGILILCGEYSCYEYEEVEEWKFYMTRVQSLNSSFLINERIKKLINIHWASRSLERIYKKYKKIF